MYKITTEARRTQRKPLCLRVWIHLCLIVLFYAFAAVQAYGQQPEQHHEPARDNTRLKVGLVLSGGGARGVAHVGVIEWMEKNHIPVDYIAGTSMGGLIGAIYAMGRSPEEMKKLLLSQNWDQLLSQGPGYDQLSFRRKDDKRTYQIDIEMGYRNGLSLPLGVSSAHYIGLLIDRQTLPYSNLSSFDELPIPYRCVATDLVSAKSLVLKDGSLASAMRATMSIPGVFPPVERDNAVLVDGGLLNNIPTDVIRSMQPDVVIAVDVGTKLADIQTINSLSGILGQSIIIMTLENDRRNLGLADLIIAPDLGELSFLDFSSIEKSFEIGYQAAESKANILKKFALGSEEWERYVAIRNSKVRIDVPTPRQIVIAGNDKQLQQSLGKKLSPDIGRPLNIDNLEANLNRITGQGKYESVGYRFLPGTENTGPNILEITATEKRHAPPVINMGVVIDGSDVNAINFTIGSRVTLYDMWRPGTEWRIDSRLGFENLFATEYFVPFGQTGFFVAPHAGYRRERQGVFSGRNRFAEYRADRYGTGIDLGYLTDRSELRIGYEFGKIQAVSLTGEPGLPDVEGIVSYAHVRWAFDGQDSQTIPRRGIRFIADGKWYLAAPNSAADFPQLEIKGSVFHPMSRWGSLFGALSAGTSFNRSAPAFQQFLIGGPFKYGAMERDELRVNHYALGTFGYLHKIYQLPSLVGSTVYAGAWIDQLATWSGGATLAGPQRLRSALSTGLILDTKLGPFSIVGSYGEEGRGQIYFSLGRFF